MASNESEEWNAFRVDLLRAKHQGTPGESELIARLTDMLKRRNMYVLRALRDAKISAPSGDLPPNTFWAKAAIYGLTNVQYPAQTGPAGTDNFGLWRDDHGKRKG